MISSRRTVERSRPDGDEVASLRAEVAEVRAQLGRLGDLLELVTTPDRRTPCFVGDATVLAPTHFDRWIYLDADDRTLCPRIITTGTWEAGTTRFLQTYIPTGGRYVEVGASYGYYALQAACLVGDDGEMIAFEPAPRYYSLLHRTIETNGMWNRSSLHRVAVTDQVGTATFHLTGDWHAGSGFYPPIDPVLPIEVTEIDVSTTTLDVALDDRPVDFLKMDAEGSEGAVIDGAAAVIERSPDLVAVIEISSRAWDPEADDSARLLGSLADRGFRFWLIADDGSAVERPIDAILASAQVAARDVCCARDTPVPRPGYPSLIVG